MPALLGTRRVAKANPNQLGDLLRCVGRMTERSRATHTFCSLELTPQRLVRFMQAGHLSVLIFGHLTRCAEGKSVIREQNRT